MTSKFFPNGLGVLSRGGEAAADVACLPVNGKSKRTLIALEAAMHQGGEIGSPDLLNIHGAMIPFYYFKVNYLEVLTLVTKG